MILVSKKGSFCPKKGSSKPRNHSSKNFNKKNHSFWESYNSYSKKNHSFWNSYDSCAEKNDSFCKRNYSRCKKNDSSDVLILLKESFVRFEKNSGIILLKNGIIPWNSENFEESFLEVMKILRNHSLVFEKKKQSFLWIPKILRNHSLELCKFWGIIPWNSEKSEESFLGVLKILRNHSLVFWKKIIETFRETGIDEHGFCHFLGYI